MKRFTLIFMCLFGLLTACQNSSDDDMGASNFVGFKVWSGSTITFEKANGADPTLSTNQDRITDNVWITRGNNGGQIYNAVTENEATKSTSPDGTLWAEGTTSELDNLVFESFRTAVVKPQDVIGKNLVMLSIVDSIAINVKFTKWTGNQAGGFAYERSSE